MSWYKNNFETLSINPIIQYRLVPRIVVSLNYLFFTGINFINRMINSKFPENIILLHESSLGEFIQ